MAKGVVVHMKPKNGERSRRRRPAAQPPPPVSVATPRSGMSKKKIVEESRRWLSIINAHKLNDYKRRKIVADTLDNFRLHYNKGYLEYRKSVTEGGQYADTGITANERPTSGVGNACSPVTARGNIRHHAI